MENSGAEGAPARRRCYTQAAEMAPVRRTVARRRRHARGSTGCGARRMTTGERAEVEVRRSGVRRRDGDAAPDGLP